MEYSLTNGVANVDSVVECGNAETEKEMRMTEAETGKKWTLRENLLADILPAINHATEDDFAGSLFMELQANGDLCHKVIEHRGHKMIAQRMIVGSIPPRAKPVVRKFITDLLLKGRFANC